MSRCHRRGGLLPAISFLAESEFVRGHPSRSLDFPPNRPLSTQSGHLQLQPARISDFPFENAVTLCSFFLWYQSGASGEFIAKLALNGPRER
jgi:hypothetical protein